MSSEFKSSDFASRQGYEFAKKLREVCPNGGRRFSEVFDDFCAISAISLQQGVCKLRTGEIDAELEAEYMRRVGRYDRERVTHFPEAFAIMVEGLEMSFQLAEARAQPSSGRFSGDFLGDVFMSAECGNDWHGQFFTPWHLCELMARMTVGEATPDPAKRLTIAEPACGAGAMLLAAGGILREREFGPLDWWFSATDIDERCFYMAYVQLALTGAPGVVFLGNSLSREPMRRAWVTPTGALYPYRNRLGESPPQDVHEDAPQDAPAPPGEPL
jgi:hypothetical protein